MANNLTTQSAVASTVPSGSEIATYDTGDGHRQVVVSAAGGTTAFTDPTCDTGADLILAANAERISALIVNAGTVKCYLGPSGVTTTSGIPLEPGASLADSDSVSAWYGITAAGTADLRVCEVS